MTTRTGNGVAQAPPGVQWEISAGAAGAAPSGSEMRQALASAAVRISKRMMTAYPFHVRETRPLADVSLADQNLCEIVAW